MTSEVQGVFSSDSRAMRLKPQVLQLFPLYFPLARTSVFLQGPHSKDGFIYIFVLAFSFLMFHAYMVCMCICMFVCVWAHVGEFLLVEVQSWVNETEITLLPYSLRQGVPIEPRAH